MFYIYWKIIYKKEKQRMNNVYKKYLRTVKAFFPVMGVEEKKYLKNLRYAMYDYCEQYHEYTIDDLYREFGEPRQIAHEFYTNANQKLLMKRIHIATFAKRFLIVFLSLALLATFTYCIFGYRAQKIFEKETAFSEEIVITK